MQEVKRKKVFGLAVRARLPLVVRYLSLAALVGAIVFVILGYRRAEPIREFVMRGGAPELARTVEREVYNFERRISEGDRLRLMLRANKEVTYTDGHHELEGVYLEAYPANGEPRPDRIASRKAVYDLDKGTVSFNGAVQISTRDNLVASTEQAVYHQREERAETPVPISFRRENVTGRADAATLDEKNKHLTLRGAVEIIVSPRAEGSAPDGRTPNLEKPVVLRAPQADFDKAKMQLAFTGGASAEQSLDLMRGDSLAATLSEQKRVQRIEARGNSYLRSMTQGRAAEVSSVNMDFFFDANQRFERALATGGVRARSLDADSEMNLKDAERAEVLFVVQAERSAIKELRAEGRRPVLTLSAPKSQAGNPNAANKQLTADGVKLFWRETGRDLERAEAVGNAELVIEPLQPTANAERKTLVAPRFDCDFYETGNLARRFKATGGARANFTPLQPSPMRLPRVLTAQEMTANFMREAQDVERVEATGEARFNEGVRNGQAATITYTTADAVVRLRGGEPVVWDDRARLKAAEIDSDTRSRISSTRGGTQTAYYSQEQTGGATPFAKVKSPVFVTSAIAEFGHDTGIGIYSGDARAWQDDNFVRGNRLTLRRNEQRMDAEGAVQSALYQARRKEASGARTVVPVFATAQRMFFSAPERLINYAGSVDIKQGTERITGERASIFLQANQNEVERTVAEGNVVVTQPGKRATGEWAQYTATDETVVLTGDPARVEDSERGTTESKRLTVYLRENRVVSDDPRGDQGTGRVRSTHRIRKQ